MTLYDHFKGLVITLILFIGFFGCLAPLRIAAEKTTMSYATCFSGGVILSVAFCHLLPDAGSDLAGLTNFPLANFFSILGLFAVMFFEKVVMGPHEAVIGQLTKVPDDVDDCLGGSLKCLSSPTSPQPVLNEEPCYGWEGSVKDLSKSCTLGDNHHHHVLYSSKAFREGLESGLNFARHMTEAEGLRDCEMTYEEQTTSWWVPFTLLLVLSFHSVIEGLALGSAEKPAEVFVMTVAILSHKFLAAVSLGISFVTAQVPPSTHVSYALFFSLMTPFGALLGVIISSVLNANFVSLFAAACQAIGSGTFIYISLLELLPHELDGEFVGKKMGFTLLGFLLMAGVAVYI
eukprot:TRINITY_DN5357_c0_g1_i1.p1 TRINITY_DN5357_c0_g1~~TRINITY_DN5357_c0_g1_i1.p1  ORF type:complete len:346 (+),score=94.25 TRINITY_DN5357_c0_g1_i1:127-1164(+)